MEEVSNVGVMDSWLEERGCGDIAIVNGIVCIRSVSQSRGEYGSKRSRVYLDVQINRVVYKSTDS